MYENWNLTEELEPGIKCIRVTHYSNGETVEVFRESVPARRISADSTAEVLRTLVGLYAGWNGRFILHSRLNARPGNPERYPPFSYQHTYPEPGVKRLYVHSGDTQAWVDEVIDAAQFRQQGNGENVA